MEIVKNCHSLVLHKIGSENIALGFAYGSGRMESAFDQTHFLLAVPLHHNPVIVNSVTLQLNQFNAIQLSNQKRICQKLILRWNGRRLWLNRNCLSQRSKDEKLQCCPLSSPGNLKRGIAMQIYANFMQILSHSLIRVSGGGPESLKPTEPIRLELNQAIAEDRRVLQESPI